MNVNVSADIPKSIKNSEKNETILPLWLLETSAVFNEFEKMKIIKAIADIAKMME